MSRKSGVPKRILIVDGYNVLNAHKPVMDSLALADARDALRAKLQDYAGFSGQKVILVFDAWLSDRTMRSVEEYGPVRVVFTQKGETADRYIERLCDDYSDAIAYRQVEVRVATSDSLEQTIVLGRGAIRISARELLYEMEQVRSQGAKRVSQSVSRRNPLADRLPEHVRAKLEEMRREK